MPILKKSDFMIVCLLLVLFPLWGKLEGGAFFQSFRNGVLGVVDFGGRNSFRMTSL